MKKFIEEIISYFKGGAKQTQIQKVNPKKTTTQTQSQKVNPKKATTQTQSQKVNPKKATAQAQSPIQKTSVDSQDQDTSGPKETSVDSQDQDTTKTTRNANVQENILNRIRPIIVDKLGLGDESKVTNEASFVDDLGADSLDLVELIIEFEYEFSTSLPLPDAEVCNLKTVQEALDYIESKLQSGGSLDVLKQKKKSYNDALRYIMKNGTVGGAIEYYSGSICKK